MASSLRALGHLAVSLPISVLSSGENRIQICCSGTWTRSSRCSNSLPPTGLPDQQVSFSTLTSQLNGIQRLLPPGSSGRSVHYESSDSYVLMEPGEDEVFVSASELRTKLIGWLQSWPDREDLPADLSKFHSLDEAVSHLIDSACELHLGGGQGTLQWFEVRMESGDM